MFHFGRFASCTYIFNARYPDFPRDGLPHSDIHGSTLARKSPWLFAACRVLPRPLMPGHPPYALPVLTLIFPSVVKEQYRRWRNSTFNVPSSAISFKLCTLNFKRRTSLFGGGERDRTDDPLLAKQVLSQLSYTPKKFTRKILLSKFKVRCSRLKKGIISPLQFLRYFICLTPSSER